MYARVVRFTDVTDDRIEEIKNRISENDGPPEGVESTGIKFVYDKEQDSVVVIQFFETEEKMRDAAAVFDQMDPSETPGTRASVDLCEIKAEATAS